MTSTQLKPRPHVSQEIAQEEAALVPLPRRGVPVAQGVPARALPPRHPLRELESPDAAGLRGHPLLRGEQIEREGELRALGVGGIRRRRNVGLRQ